MTSSEALLSAFDVDEMSVEALLFQTGYLTIVDEEDRGGRIRYRLGLPQPGGAPKPQRAPAGGPAARRRQAARRRRPAPRTAWPPTTSTGWRRSFRSLFAGVPHQWHVNNNIQDYEGYYASVVYSCFAAHGFDLIPEDSSSAGRSDMVVRCNDGHLPIRVQAAEGCARGQGSGPNQEQGAMPKNTATSASPST